MSKNKTKSRRTFMKVSPADIDIDREFQRTLEESRCKAMSKSIELDRIGVPVLSKRPNGKLVALDGQHRIVALKMADKGQHQVLCEVHEGLTIVEEAALFLKLNGGRKAIRVYDKWKARIVANDPIAHEILGVVKSLGLRVAVNPGRANICAIREIESAHVRNRNLKETLSVLKRWSDGDQTKVYEGDMIKYMSHFLRLHPDVNVDKLLERLAPMSAERVLLRMKRMQGTDYDVSRVVAACNVLRDIYNYKSKNRLSTSEKPAPQQTAMQH